MMKTSVCISSLVVVNDVNAYTIYHTPSHTTSRHHITRRFNMSLKDFDSDKAYNDELELMEEIIFDKLYGTGEVRIVLTSVCMA